MNLFFKIVLITISFECHSRTLFNITFKSNIEEAKRVKAVLQKYFYIKQESISFHKRKIPCSKQSTDFIQICIEENRELKVFDRTGNKFKSLKSLLKTEMTKLGKKE